MPKPDPTKPPAYRHYKPKNLGVVRIRGKDYYLGRFGTPESHAMYRRVVAEHWGGTAPSPNGPEPQTPSAPESGPTINELLLAFWRHAMTHYRGPDGQATQELSNMADAIRPLRRLFEHQPAASFGPLALRAVRDEMVKTGLARTTVNARINRIRRVFKWAASVEMIPASVPQALDNVDGLQRGRSLAREPAPVESVPAEIVEATLPHLSPVVAAMVRVQMLTGMRAGEVMQMRGLDLTKGDPNWEYRPRVHKNAWRGRARVVVLGPRAVEVIRPFLKDDPTASIFSPRDVVSAIRAQRKGGRAIARVAEKYDRRTYRQAIIRACDRAGVPRWSPLRLRHSAATAIDARFGVEATANVLGHAKPDTSAIYIQRDVRRAHEVMKEIG